MVFATTRHFSTAQAVMRTVAAAVIKILNVRWSWARMRCVWKLPNIS